MRYFADEHGNYWYYEMHGKQLGPASIGRIRQLVRAGQIKSCDRLRKGVVGEWAAVASFEEMSDAIHHRQMIGESLPDVSSVDEPMTTTTSTVMAIWLKEAFVYYSAYWRDAIVARSALIGTVCNIAVFAVLLGLFVRTHFKIAVVVDWVSADPLVVYERLWEEFKANTKAELAADRWNAFVERGRRQVAGTLSGLQAKAGASDRQSQLLLWAGRDCLMKLFEDSRNHNVETEKLLEEHLGNVRLLREGRILYSTRRAESLLYLGWLGGVTSTALLTLILIAVNVVLLCWIGMMTARARS